MEHLDEKIVTDLVKRAIEMRNFSYAPYSNFCVGAALFTKDGKIYTGCNIENSAFSPSICAERVAFFKAISEGNREFRTITIAGAKKGSSLKFCPPCGVCRQVMVEFCTLEFQIILVKSESEYKIYTLKELLPLSFSL